MEFLNNNLNIFFWFVLFLGFIPFGDCKRAKVEARVCTRLSPCYYYSYNGLKHDYISDDDANRFIIDDAWDYSESIPMEVDMRFSFPCNPPDVDLDEIIHLNHCFKRDDEHLFIITDDVDLPRAKFQLRDVVKSETCDGSTGRACDEDVVDSDDNSNGQSISDRKLCSELHAFYKKKGFIPRSKHDEYCLSGCNFLRVHCDSTRSEPLGDKVRSRVDAVHNFLEDILEGGVRQDKLEVDDDLKDTWYVAAYNIWPALLAIIPIILNQYKKYNLFGAIALMALFALVQPQFSPLMICAHNFLIAFLSLVHSDTSHYLIESMASLGMCYAVLFLVFISDPFFQFMILVAAVFGFSAYLFTIFTARKGGNHAHLLMCVLHFLMVMEQLEFIRREFAENSLLGAGIDMLLSAVMPRSEGNYLILNLCEISRQVVNRVGVFVAYKPFILLICMMVYVFLFISFRGFLGAYCLFTLRYKKDFGAFMKGLYLYMCDVFGPFKAFFRIVLNYESFNTRRICYVVISILLMVYEVRSALDFFVLRILMSLVDNLIIKSDIGRVTKYLGEHVDLGNSSFPQDGSFPWINLDQVLELAKHVDWVHFKTDNSDKEDVKGVGIVFKTAGKNMLYTVRHLTDGIKSVNFRGVSILDPNFRYVSRARDPIVCTKLKNYKMDPPSLNILSPSEVSDVESLMFINLDDIGTKFINVVPRFSIKGEVLQASVDLKNGDSGGPTFAILNNGGLRYCGTVSAGAPRDGGGNIITFVVGTGLPGNDSSDDDYDGDVDYVVDRFNTERGRLKLATFDCKRNEYQLFIKRLKGAVQSFLFLSTQPIKPDLEDLETDESIEGFLSKLGDAIAGDGERLERPRRVEFEDEEHDDGEDTHRARQGNKRVKSSRKDKAARKRALAKVAGVVDVMRVVYDSDQLGSMYDAMISGRMPSMTGKDFVHPSECGEYMYVDSFPSGTRA